MRIAYDNNFSQRKLAKFLGITPQTLTNYFSDKQYKPRGYYYKIRIERKLDKFFKTYGNKSFNKEKFSFKSLIQYIFNVFKKEK